MALPKTLQQPGRMAAMAAAQARAADGQWHPVIKRVVIGRDNPRFPKDNPLPYLPAPKRRPTAADMAPVVVGAETGPQLAYEALLREWMNADAEQRRALWNAEQRGMHEVQAQQAGYLHVRYRYRRGQKPALAGYPRPIVATDATSYRHRAGSNRAEAGLPVRSSGRHYEIVRYGRDEMLQTPYAIVRIFGLRRAHGMDYRMELPEDPARSPEANRHYWVREIRRAVNAFLA